MNEAILDDVVWDAAFNADRGSASALADIEGRAFLVVVSAGRGFWFAIVWDVRCCLLFLPDVRFCLPCRDWLRVGAARRTLSYLYYLTMYMYRFSCLVSYYYFVV